jgi:hypothetical protein
VGLCVASWGQNRSKDKEDDISKSAIWNQKMKGGQVFAVYYSNSISETRR